MKYSIIEDKNRENFQAFIKCIKIKKLQFKRIKETGISFNSFPIDAHNEVHNIKKPRILKSCLLSLKSLPVFSNYTFQNNIHLAF